MKIKEIFQYILGAVIVIGFFSVLVVMVAKGGYPGMVELIVGALIAAFGTVVGYFYGSSKGSADKSEALHQQIINSTTANN
jgi:hypothetical protein